MRPRPARPAFLTVQLTEHAGMSLAQAVIVSGMGIVIGISGIILPTVSGWMIDHHGFTPNDLMLAAACLLALVPIAFVRETVTTTSAAT